MTLAPTGNGYITIPGGTGWYTPTSTNLGLSDDQVSAAQSLGFPLLYPGGITNEIYISSNGIVWGGPTTVNGCCSGNAAQLLANQPCWAPNWGDLNPTAGGSVHFDTDPTAQAAYVTFLDVPEFGTSNLNTFQVAFFASGMVEYRFQNCLQTNRISLTGWSPGGNAIDPGSIDISASLPIVTAPDSRGLRHDSSARPVLGTSINLRTAELPNGVQIGSTLLGLTEYTTGIDLSSFGMPGCFQYTSVESSTVWVPVNGVGTTPFAIPSNSSLAGVRIKTQGIALVPNANPTGAQTSNGLRLTLNPN